MPKANYGFKGTALTLADAVAAGAVIPASQYQYFSQLSAISPLLPPGIPTGLNITGGNQQVTVAWVAPTDSGRTSITGYRVYYINDSGTLSSVATSTTSATITGLTSTSPYSFSVVAYSDVAGEGDSATVTGSPSSGPVFSNVSYTQTGSGGTWTSQYATFSLTGGNGQNTLAFSHTFADQPGYYGRNIKIYFTVTSPAIFAIPGGWQISARQVNNAGLSSDASHPGFSINKDGTYSLDTGLPYTNSQSNFSPAPAIYFYLQTGNYWMY